MNANRESDTGSTKDTSCVVFIAVSFPHLTSMAESYSNDRSIITLLDLSRFQFAKKKGNQTWNRSMMSGNDLQLTEIIAERKRHVYIFRTHSEEESRHTHTYTTAVA